MLSDDFRLLQPRRCRYRPGALFRALRADSDLIVDFRFERLIEEGEEVFVTYKSTKSDGNRFRNTEVLTFAGERLRKAEVYFGWNV